MASTTPTDLVSASTSKLEPLPTGGGPSSVEKPEELTEEEWLEMMKEKADRSSLFGGDPRVFAVGQHYFSEQEYANAFKYFEKAAGVKAAEGGIGDTYGNFSSQAKYQLGVMYYDGLGVEEDPVKGSEFMLQVAQSSDKKDSHIVPSAQYNMGRAYFMGFGVPQSDSEAEKWWCSAASHGDDPSSLRARHTLGLYYSRPDSLNLEESCKWHLEAAENGNMESMAALGVMLIQGQGCSKNEGEGLDWLRKSAHGGSTYGEGLLSRQYLAMKLYSKAAETAFRVSEIAEPPSQHEEGSDIVTSLSALDRIGVATACFVLARCLQLGNAVTKNEPKAMTYYDKAKRFDLKVVAEMHAQLTHGQL